MTRLHPNLSEYRLTVRERILFHSSVDPDTGCWDWDAPHTGGYGRLSVGSRYHRAHRVSFEAFVGPIPDGLQIDHLCRNRSCVNPAHLEAVTHRENTLRGVAPPAINAKKDTCWRGHEFTDENTYTTKGGHRNCRRCHRENSARRRRLSLVKTHGNSGYANGCRCDICREGRQAYLAGRETRVA